MFDPMRLGDGAFSIRRFAAGAFVALAIVGWEPLDFLVAGFRFFDRAKIVIRCYLGVRSM
jgi:hypothetical protein